MSTNLTGLASAPESVNALRARDIPRLHLRIKRISPPHCSPATCYYFPALCFRAHGG